MSPNKVCLVETPIGDPAHHQEGKKQRDRGEVVDQRWPYDLSQRLLILEEPGHSLVIGILLELIASYVCVDLFDSLEADEAGAGFT